MGDDITIVVPEPAPEPIEETTYEQLGEELLTRLDELTAQLEEAYARITELEARITEFGGREYLSTTDLDGRFAEIGHHHDEYVGREEYDQFRADQEKKSSAKRKPDKEPEPQHWFFRRVGS